MSARAGLDMRDLIEAAHSYKSVEKYANKKKIMEYIVQNIDQYASNPRRSKFHDSIFQRIKYFGESLFCGSGIYLGNYLVTTYFFIKIVYLINSIVQFFIMNEFLGKQFHELGMDILRYMTNTYSVENSAESVYFPKVVMCDFRIREFGHPNFSHRYTIQCVLPINLYNQQIFTFLWFWFLILFFANCWAMCQWTSRMLPKHRRRYINRRLNMLKYFRELNKSTSVTIKQRGLFNNYRKTISFEAKKQKGKFIDEYLKFDGVFILQMISMLTSEIVGTELLHELWTKRAVVHQTNDDDDYAHPPRPPQQQSNHAVSYSNNYDNNNNGNNSLNVPVRKTSLNSSHSQESFHVNPPPMRSGQNGGSFKITNNPNKIEHEGPPPIVEESRNNSVVVENVTSMEKEKEAEANATSGGSGVDLRSMRGSRVLRGRVASLRAFTENARRDSRIVTSDILSLLKQQQQLAETSNQENGSNSNVSENNDNNSNESSYAKRQSIDFERPIFEEFEQGMEAQSLARGQTTPQPIHKRSKMARLKQQLSVDIQSSLRMKTKRFFSSQHGAHQAFNNDILTTMDRSNLMPDQQHASVSSIVKKSSTGSLRDQSNRALSVNMDNSLASNINRPAKKVAFASSVCENEEDEDKDQYNNNNNNNSDNANNAKKKSGSSTNSGLLNEFDDVFSDLKLDMITDH